MTQQRRDSEKPSRRRDDGEVGPPVPPDGGWGWMVVIASLFCNIIVDGVCFSFGVFYPEFIEYFGESRGKTAIVGSLIPGMYLGMGPIASALANKFGCRPVAMAGSIMAACSFFMSTFSPNVNVLIVTYGVLGGTGFGLMYLPSIVIVGFYFNKRRAFATGLAVCGSGIGTFFFAPFGRFLLDYYGWKGGYWIISGIILNGCICGALFRPLTATLIKPKPQEMVELKKKKKKHGNIISETINEKEHVQEAESRSSLDGLLVTKTNKLLGDEGKTKELTTDGGVLQRNAVNTEKVNNYVKPFGNARIVKLRGEEVAFQPPLPLPTEHPEEEAEANDTTEPLLKSNDNSLISSTRSLAFFTQSSDVRKSRGRSLSESLNNDIRYRISRHGEKVRLEEATAKCTELELRAEEVARPMNRKDIFLMGSVANLREFKMNPNMESYMASTATIPPIERDAACAGCNPLLRVLREMLDFSLMKSPTFLLLCAASILAMTGFFTPFVYITDNAIQLGIDPMTAAYLLSVLGMCNTFGRILCGLVSDMPWADCLLIHNVALIIAGVTTCIVPFLESFALLCAYCVIFGFCIAAFITLRSIVLVDLLGLQKLTSSFGLLLLFQGIASVIGSPIAGAIFDTTQSYTLSFIVSGCLIAVSGCMGLPVRRVAAWEARKWGPLGGESDVTKIPNP